MTTIPADLLVWLVETTLVTSVALLLVLLLRAPLRATFGANVAYAAWLLLPLSILAVSLPAPARDVLSPISTLVAPYLSTGGVTVHAAQPVGQPEVEASLPMWWLVMAVWAAGAIACALLFLHRQRRYIEALGKLERDGNGIIWAQGANACPAVVGAWLPWIVLPKDFSTRYSQYEGELVIAHEHVHLRRNDSRVNALLVLLRCVYWFNPLLHWAAGKFQLDQELACDAVVLACYPNSRRAYAGAMLKTQLAVLGLPVGCHWQSSRSLKERILMLKKPQPGVLRRRGGIAALATVLVVSSYAAWALQPTSVTAPAYYGFVEENAVAIASINVPEGLDLAIRGPSMMGGLDSRTTNVMLDPRIDLEISSIDDAMPWTLRLWGTGTADAPGTKWTLERDGRVVDEGTQPIPAGSPSNLALTLPMDKAGRAPSIVFSRLPDDRIVARGQSGEAETLVRDADGAYRGAPIVAYGDSYGANGGEATLLLHVDTRGRVQRVDIERSIPAGAIDIEQARDLVERTVYTPKFVDGRAVPSRIRVPVHFWRDIPQETKPVAVTGNATDIVASTPAPVYPPAALAAKQRGYVLLHVLVAVDGSIKEARVVQSYPAGVFDAVTIEAARKWKLKPEVKDGKPIEAWMRVPVTFEPSAKPLESFGTGTGNT